MMCMVVVPLLFHRAWVQVIIATTLILVRAGLFHGYPHEYHNPRVLRRVGAEGSQTFTVSGRNWEGRYIDQNRIELEEFPDGFYWGCLRLVCLGPQTVIVHGVGVSVFA